MDRKWVDQVLFSMKARLWISVGGRNGNDTNDTSRSCKTLNRSILLTERGMSGSGGDDFICGHCGYVILEDFDPSTIKGNPVYQCGFCENNNDLPFAASGRRSVSG
jgi:hypothetical protein